jgi:lipoprotein-releasing system permease protein
MNFELFIAKRLIKAKGKVFSRPIVLIATLSISLGIAVMVLSIFVLSGFKNQIKEKIVGFSSHVQIIPYNVSNSYLSNPIILNAEERGKLKNIKNIKSISPFVSKGGAIKTKTDFMGVFLKGIDKNYDTTFFHNNLKEGRNILTSKESSSEAMISKTVANKLNLKLGEKIRVYFYIDENYRQRAFTIVGIYETGLGIYDEKVIVCDMHQLQSLNLWQENQVEAYEVMLKDFNRINESSEEIYYSLAQDKSIRTIEEIEPNLFAWLGLLDSNVIVILVVMMLVSIVIICSALLIMIFEKTHMIGVLKGLGATTNSIAKIFLYKALYIILKGIIYGNIIAIGISFLQKQYKVFSLDSQSYFLDSVPIEMDFRWVLIVNIAAVVICLLALLIPARSITRINPINNINTDK